MVFLVGGANSATGFAIENSLRFNDDDSASLTRTPSSAGNRKTFTFSTWVKRSKIGGQQTILLAYGADSNLGYNALVFTTTGQLALLGWSANWLVSTALFRDPAAWYHIVLAVDTTDGTANDRVKLYVNGSQLTDFGTRNNPSQNDDFAINDDEEHNIGSRRAYSTSDDYFDGYLSETYLVDGSQLTPTSFGETNDNGVWVPIKYTGSYGTNGFKLEYKQTGTSANASGIGADTSGNTHHWTLNGLAATDVTTDTPTNNFATMNPLASIATLSEGNCKVVTTNGERMAGASTIGFENGKWYMEYKVTNINSTNMTIGIDNENGLSFSDFRDNDDFWNASNAYAYENNGNKRTTSVNSSYGNSYTTGDIIGVAVDMDNRKIYFSKNGTYQNSGDPTTGSTGTGSAFDLTDGLTYFFQAADNSGAAGVTLEANFGQPSFSISSGNADANGYGNFEYSVPSGYFALCTKNLAEYG